MVFSYKNIKLKIEFSFIIVLALSLVQNSKNVLFVILFSSLHELGHLVSLLAFKAKQINLKISYYGIALKYDETLSVNREIIFLVSGLAVNLVFAALNIYREINLMLFLINVLPIYPLDGARTLKLILSKRFSFKISTATLKAVSLLFLILLTALAVFYKNLSLLIIVIYSAVYSLNNYFD